MTEHLLGDVEIGNHSVFHRTDGGNASRGAAQHQFGFMSDRQYGFLSGKIFFDCHH